MARVLSRLAGVGLVFAASATCASEAPARYQLRTDIDTSYVNVSVHPSWIGGSVGKLRYDDDGLIISRAFADYGFHLTDTLKVNAAIETYGDDVGLAIDFTETYVEWRPVPQSENRYRMKFGAFYPRISLENASAG